MGKRHFTIIVFAIITTYCFGQTHYQAGAYCFDFENTNNDNYILNNDPSGFGWYLGNVTSCGGVNSIYAKSHPFNSGSSTVSLGGTFSAQFYLHLTEGITTISFDWKARNISPYGRLFVFLIPIDAGSYSIDGLNSNQRHIILPNGSIQIAGSNGLYNNTIWQTFSQNITIPETGDYVLYFVWFEVLYDSSPNYNSYSWVAAVDNIIVQNPESYATSFENGENFYRWHLDNDGSNVDWCIGSSVSCNGSNSLYISNNNGISNSYLNSMASFAYAYRDVCLRAGNWNISYDWRSVGEDDGDYMRVFLVPQNQSLASIGYNLVSLPSDAIALDGGNTLCNQAFWNHFSSSFVIPNGGLSNYKLVFYWVSNGNNIGDNPPAAVDNIAINYRPDLTIELNNPYHCTAYGNGQYDYMDTAVVHIITDEHYHVSRLYGDAVNTSLCYISSKKDTSAFFMDNNITLYVNVDIDTHIVQVNSRLNYGNVSVTDGGLIQYGNYCTVAAEAIDTNYRFYIWSNGETDNPYTFIVTKDTSLTAIFLAPNEGHLLCVSAIDSSRGYVERNGQCIFNDLFQEGTIVLTAVPNYGYHFVQWNDGTTTNPRAINLTQDTTFTAIFAIDQYTLSLSSNNSTFGATSGSGTYDYLSQVSISATPAPHCHFVQWSDGNTSNPRIITVTQNASYTAYFAPDPQYNINITANDTTMGTATGGGLFYVGEQTVLTASAKNHYHFISWDDGINDNPRTITVIDDRDYTALFAPINHILNITSNDDYMGSVYGGGIYPYGSTANIDAQPFDGYHFISWSDGDINSYREIYVDEDINLQAQFGYGSEAGIDIVTGQPMITTKSNDIIISGAEGLSIYLYDILGRIVSSINKASIKHIFSVTIEGVYIVKIEGYKPQKCLVR